MKNNKKAEKEKVISSALTADTLEANANNVQQDNQPQKTTAPANAKKTKNVKAKKGDNAFVRFFKRIGRSFKEMGSELKKVSWPTIGKALKSTGIVLAFVVIFLVVLMGIDALFGFGFNQLIGIQG